MRTLRASEIGSFLYCRRSWWYQQQGIPSENQAEMAGGTDYHQKVGKKVASAGLFRLLAWLILLAAIVLLAVGGTLLVLK